ncbi:hypothetical protein [Magnetospirillum molischianum]|uniref:Uncharacterized protein n=1 Tax=Magnetospirillum molischianum DSM 120 TaxID=1150626 RepID=H8FTX1_MAGML|nr:hypothetical protein [Magnetospirillum molischianum]CCG41828.1 hypothetical protein PHAMO_290116 [Magnetospirillum molischianum DSM 120]
MTGSESEERDQGGIASGLRYWWNMRGCYDPPPPRPAPEPPRQEPAVDPAIPGGIERWFANLFLSWATKVQRKEITRFTDALRAMDSDEIGALLALATDLRHTLEADSRLDLLDPRAVEIIWPSAAQALNRQIRNMQATNSRELAAAAMVWLHTIRAANNPDLRMLGREMWRQLERGFPKVEQAAADLQVVGMSHLNIEGYSVFPLGLSPDPT